MEIALNDSANSIMLNAKENVGVQQFGLMSNYAWYDDPKRLAFHFSRYKFVSKMLAGEFDAAYSLDVLEHIDTQYEDA